MAGRRVRRRVDSYRTYLQSLTFRNYLRDYFLAEGYRAAIGVVIGLLFLGYGIVRMVTETSWQSLGVVFVGFAVTLLSLISPLLMGLGYALAGKGDEWVWRHRSR